MGTWFDMLQDKFKAPYFTDAEKTVFLQRAHIGFVKDMLWPDGKNGSDNLEVSQDSIAQIATLIYELPNPISMSSTGVVLKSTLQTALTGVSATAIMWRPLAIGWDLGADVHPVSYVRHNDWYKFQENYFKNPTAENPKTRERATDYQFLPIRPSAKLYFTLLKYPAKVVLDTVTPVNNVNSDLPDFTHDKIVALALEYAGISSRDEALAQLLQIKK